MSQVIMEHNVAVPMRDGVTLYANVYRPAAEGEYPVLLTRLPYGKDIYPTHGLLDPIRAALAGYIVIIQDCRGRFRSEGDFAPLQTEGLDGYDTVEWAAALPNSNGRVGMYGASYFGFTQMAAAAEQPPHLKCIVPAITWSEYGDGASFRDGVTELGLSLNWNLLMAIDRTQRQMVATGAAPMAIMARMRKIAAAVDRLSQDGYDELPLQSLDWLSELGLADLFALPLSAGPSGQPAFANVDHTRIAVPALHIGGWYDIFIQGTLDNFAAMRARGVPSHLLIGPWTHLDRGSRIGDLNFGLAASGASIDLTMDLTAIHLRWYDRWLKELPNGVDQEPPVRLFTMGTNQWARFTSWPPAEATPARWYLQTAGGLSLDAPMVAGGASTYQYDPAHPVPTLGGNLLMPGAYGSGPYDHRSASLRADVLTFTSDPVAEPVCIMGRVEACLWIASSAPDTDFVVRLIDIHPNGYMQNLCDGIARARYRNSFAEPTWLSPGEPADITVDLWSVAHTILPDHKIAVQVTSSNFPRWDRNLNTADPIGQGTTWQIADQTIFHAKEHPSYIQLPIYRP
jgi:putative CocE/NonD family hydrolase